MLDVCKSYCVVCAYGRMPLSATRAARAALGAAHVWPVGGLCRPALEAPPRGRLRPEGASRTCRGDGNILEHIVDLLLSRASLLRPHSPTVTVSTPHSRHDDHVAAEFSSCTAQKVWPCYTIIIVFLTCFPECFCRVFMCGVPPSSLTHPPPSQ
jgi:hypothetical protein